MDPNQDPNKKRWLTDDEKRKYDLDVAEEYFWNKTDNIQRKDGRMVRRFDATSEEQARRAARKRVAPSDKILIENLIAEDMGKSYDEASTREQLLATMAVTGTSADRKIWNEHVVKIRGEQAATGYEVLPLELDPETNQSLISALGVIQELQRERHEQRIELLREVRQSELELGPDDIGGEDQDDCPF